MRHVKFVLLWSVLSVAACTGGGKKADETVSADKSRQERQTAASDASEALQRFETNKNQYISRSEDTVADLDAKIASYRANAPKDPAQREAHMNTVASLEDNLARAKAQLEDVRGATVETWDSEQRQLEQALLTTRAALDSANATAH